MKAKKLVYETIRNSALSDLDSVLFFNQVD